MQKNLLFFLILTTIISLEDASGEFYYFVQQNDQEWVQIFSNEGPYIINISENVDLTAPPDLLWNNIGFYFDNDYPQILMTKIDDHQKVLSICAVYDFSSSSDDFEDTKDYWMDHQLADNEDFKEFLHDIDRYLRSSSSCHATALSFVRMHNSNSSELILIHEESEPELLLQQRFEASIQQVFNKHQSQDKLKKECKNGRCEVCSSITDEDEDEYLKFGCDCGDRHSCQELEAKGDLENK